LDISIAFCLLFVFNTCLRQVNTTPDGAVLQDIHRCKTSGIRVIFENGLICGCPTIRHQSRKSGHSRHQGRSYNVEQVYDFSGSAWNLPDDLSAKGTGYFHSPFGWRVLLPEGAFGRPNPVRHSICMTFDALKNIL
jgi:hypothetical protein